mgnify:CR=1 FL=1
MEHRINKLDVTPDEAALGVEKVTLAYIDDVMIAIVTTRTGFRTAGIAIPSNKDDGAIFATTRARNLAVDRIRSMQQKLAVLG